MQPDGRVLLAGYCSNGSNNDFCAARYNANGSLDTSWNGTGKVITPIGSNGDTAKAIALQSDGKVLLAGYCFNGSNFEFCAARYNASGALDTSWNGAGKVITSIDIDSYATATTVQPDGKVLLAGYCQNGSNVDFCAARYNANGTLDSSWNGTGKVITPIGSGADRANAIAVQSDGKVLLAGYCFNGSNYDFCVARYNANGTLDTSWNGTGKVLLAGYCINGSNYDFCVARYNAGGVLDTSWNGTGKVVTSIGVAGDLASSIHVQTDDKVLLAGYCSNGSNSDFCAARYNADGSLDTTWNGTGLVITPVSSGEDNAYAMAAQPDGKILIAGNCSNGLNSDFCVARLVIETARPISTATDHSSPPLTRSSTCVWRSASLATQWSTASPSHRPPPATPGR